MQARLPGIGGTGVDQPVAIEVERHRNRQFGQRPEQRGHPHARQFPHVHYVGPEALDGTPQFGRIGAGVIAAVVMVGKPQLLPARPLSIKVDIGRASQRAPDMAIALRCRKAGRAGQDHYLVPKMLKTRCNIGSQDFRSSLYLRRIEVVD